MKLKKISIIVSIVVISIVFISAIISIVLYKQARKLDKESDPIYLEGYGVTKDYVCVKTEKEKNAKPPKQVKSLPGEDTPLTPWHRRYLPGDVVPQGLDCDVDYDQRIVSLDYYEKSYADLAGAVKKFHIPLPQKVTVKVWYAVGLPYMRVPHEFPCKMDEFRGKPGRRWIVVKCISTFNGCYSKNIFEISDGDPNFPRELVPGSNEFVAMCYRYAHSVDARVEQGINNRYKRIDRDRDFYFHRYEIDCDGLWITKGAYKFSAIKDRSDWRTYVKYYTLWRLRTPEDY